MSRRIMPDCTVFRRAAPLCAFVVLMAGLAPAEGAAQRRPRLLGRPAAPAAEPAAPSAPMQVPEGSAVPETEPEPVALPPAAAGHAAIPVTRTLQMRSTAYCLRGTTRTGVRVRDGIAAGDPAVLPLGSVVRVSHPDGRLVGVFVIMDTGGAVRGNKIDLWFASCGEARAWGSRNVVAEVLELGRA